MKTNPTKIIRFLDRIFLLFRILAILGVILIIFCLGGIFYPKEKIKQSIPVKMIVQAKCDSITCWVTYYQNTLKQCNSVKGIGLNGEVMKIGDCAASQLLLDRYLNYGDSIIVSSGKFKGIYCVKDKAASKGYLIDVWKPLNFKKGDCYKSKIIVKN